MMAKDKNKSSLFLKNAKSVSVILINHPIAFITGVFVAVIATILAIPLWCIETLSTAFAFVKTALFKVIFKKRKNTLNDSVDNFNHKQRLSDSKRRVNWE